MSLGVAPTRPAWVQTKRSDIYPLIDQRENPALREAAKGKTVLVTGSGTGIGKAIAQDFASAGATTLILAGRRPAPLEETKASLASLAPACRTVVIPTDVSSPEEVSRLFERIEGEGLALDVLVNNSATAGGMGGMLGREWENVMSIWGTNVLGPYLCTREYVKRLDGRAGTIINLSSLQSTVNLPTSNDYGVTKIALNRLNPPRAPYYASTPLATKGYVPSCPAPPTTLSENLLSSGTWIADLVAYSHRLTEVLQSELPDLRIFAIHPGAIRATEQGAKIPEKYHSFCKETPQLPAGICLRLLLPDADFLKGRYLDCTWDLEDLMKEKVQIVERDLLKSRVDMG